MFNDVILNQVTCAKGTDCDSAPPAPPTGHCLEESVETKSYNIVPLLRSDQHFQSHVRQCSQSSGFHCTLHGPPGRKAHKNESRCVLNLCC